MDQYILSIYHPSAINLDLFIISILIKGKEKTIIYYDFLSIFYCYDIHIDYMGIYVVYHSSNSHYLENISPGQFP